MPGSKKKRYKNPTGPGYVLLSDERARRMGLLADVDEPAPTPAGASRRPAAPKGALVPGGPTARARARAAQSSEPAEPAGAPGEGAEEPLEPAEPAKQKKRDQPTGGSRRRRPAGGK